MVKNRVFELSERVSNEVELVLVRRGCLDFSVVKGAFVEEVNLDAETTIVICKNSQIDDIVKGLQSQGDRLSLIFEQAVVIEREGRRAIFIPLELDVQKFLDEFLETREVEVVSIFGRTRTLIEEVFERFECCYKIITKSSLLHTVYYDDALDRQQILAQFGDCAYAFEEADLETICERTLKAKNLSLSVTLQGACLGNLCEMVKSYEILPLDAEIDGEDCKQKTYNLARKSLGNADITLCVLQQEYGCVAVGNKSEIHVFSTNHTDEICSEFALFRLFRFVTEKY